MPVFELENVGDRAFTGRLRARGPEDAVRRSGAAQPASDIRIEETGDFSGWDRVVLDGHPSGRIRLHQRMQFRRD